MRIIFAALIACGCVSLVEAADDGDDFHREWEIYRTFLAEPTCGESADGKKCEEALNSWRRDFRWAMDPAWNNEYQGQRNLAYCLSTGCDGDVKVEPVLACAWSRVVLLTGDLHIQNEDFEFEKSTCGALATDTERRVATAQANRIINLLGARE